VNYDAILHASLIRHARDVGLPEAVRLTCGHAVAELEKHEHSLNLLRVRAFALEAASGHLGSLIDDQQRLLAWAYRKLMPYSFAKQEDALAMDEIKLMLEHPEEAA